ncbi:MAG: hypothetical protein B6D58_06560 [candidate division Zixibacteria bacterium 4484_95]|nr:MAG: hypothetical protein B6D58_06560 [candidate division Zixibacteria bacterium 4484_95]RKX17507.1 MAG: hypothetical protein DRP26_06855 [candidate division Zixibacteria bacterium]
MKRELPLMIVLIFGTFMAFQYFVPHRISSDLYQEFNNWTIIIGIFAMVVGIGSLISLHYNRIKFKKPGWGYSTVTIVCLIGMMSIGLIGGTENDLFLKLYRHGLAPVTSTMFSLLAFFIASAAYRAFRARTILATLLLLAAVVVMLGRVPIGEILTGWLPRPLQFSEISNFLLYVPNTAAKRAIFIGVGLGVAAMSLKIILGIERTWLGGEGRK